MDIDKYYILDTKNSFGKKIEKTGKYPTKQENYISGYIDYKQRMQRADIRPEQIPYLKPKSSFDQQTDKNRLDRHEDYEEIIGNQEQLAQNNYKKAQQQNFYTPILKKLDGYSQFRSPLVPQYYNIKQGDGLKKKAALKNQIQRHETLDEDLLLNQNNRQLFKRQKRCISHNQNNGQYSNCDDDKQNHNNNNFLNQSMDFDQYVYKNQKRYIKRETIGEYDPSIYQRIPGISPIKKQNEIPNNLLIDVIQKQKEDKFQQQEYENQVQKSSALYNYSKLTKGLGYKPALDQQSPQCYHQSYQNERGQLMRSIRTHNSLYKEDQNNEFFIKSDSKYKDKQDQQSEQKKQEELNLNISQNNLLLSSQCQQNFSPDKTNFINYNEPLESNKSFKKYTQNINQNYGLSFSNSPIKKQKKRQLVSGQLISYNENLNKQEKLREQSIMNNEIFTERELPLRKKYSTFEHGQIQSLINQKKEYYNTLPDKMQAEDKLTQIIEKQQNNKQKDQLKQFQGIKLEKARQHNQEINDKQQEFVHQDKYRKKTMIGWTSIQKQKDDFKYENQYLQNEISDPQNQTIQKINLNLKIKEKVKNYEEDLNKTNRQLSEFVLSQEKNVDFNEEKQIFSKKDDFKFKNQGRNSQLYSTRSTNYTLNNTNSSQQENEEIQQDITFETQYNALTARNQQTQVEKQRIKQIIMDPNLRRNEAISPRPVMEQTEFIVDKNQLEKKIKMEEIMGKIKRFDPIKLQNDFLGKVVCQKYKIIQYINGGHFGGVFKAIYIKNQKNTQIDNNNKKKQRTLNSNSSILIREKESELFAVKIEDYRFIQNVKNQQMITKQEIEVLNKLKGINGFPQIQDYKITKEFGIIVQSLCKHNLKELLNMAKSETSIEEGPEFSKNTVAMIGLQMIERLEQFHNLGYIHRDLKPENIMIGNDLINCNLIYLIDFGICKKYLDKKGNHISFQEHKPFVGTYKYASEAAIQGKELGRKDDLESLGIILVYFLKGILPWNRRSQPIQTLNFEYLCQGLNKGFYEYFRYLKSLQFQDKPNYKYLKQIFRNILIKENQLNNFEFDWNYIIQPIHEQKFNFSGKQLELSDIKTIFLCKQNYSSQYSTSINVQDQSFKGNRISNSKKNIINPINQINQNQYKNIIKGSFSEVGMTSKQESNDQCEAQLQFQNQDMQINNFSNINKQQNLYTFALQSNQNNCNSFDYISNYSINEENNKIQFNNLPIKKMVKA